MPSNYESSPLTVVIGGYGFVGSAIVSLFKNESFNLIIPLKRELDITSLKSTAKFLNVTRPEIAINFASFTNIEETERQKGDKKALSWKTNVVGVSNLARVCAKLNIFLIHISTDGVFPGIKTFPGPYNEKTIAPNNYKNLSWYGYTKLKGDQVIFKKKLSSAIIRISYPFGNLKSSQDFSVKIEKYIRRGYKLFSDQYFTPTYIPDLYSALRKIIDKKIVGVFHVSCNKITTPYKFASYLSKKIILNTKPIQKDSIENYLIFKKKPKRSQFGGLETTWTRKKLRIDFHTWKEAINELYG